MQGSLGPRRAAGSAHSGAPQDAAADLYVGDVVARARRRAARPLDRPQAPGRPPGGHAHQEPRHAGRRKSDSAVAPGQGRRGEDARGDVPAAEGDLVADLQGAGERLAGAGAVHERQVDRAVLLRLGQVVAGADEEVAAGAGRTAEGVADNRGRGRGRRGGVEGDDGGADGAAGAGAGQASLADGAADGEVVVGSAEWADRQRTAEGGCGGARVLGEEGGAVGPVRHVPVQPGRDVVIVGVVERAVAVVIEACAAGEGDGAEEDLGRLARGQPELGQRDDARGGDRVREVDAGFEEECAVGVGGDELVAAAREGSAPGDGLVRLGRVGPARRGVFAELRRKVGRSAGEGRRISEGHE